LSVVGKPVPAWEKHDPAEADEEGNIFGYERRELGESIKNGRFNGLCEKVSLAVHQTLRGGHIVSLPLRASRSLKHYSNGKLALVEKAAVGLDLGTEASIDVYAGVRISPIVG